MKKAKIKDFDKYIAHVKENPKAFCNAFYDKLQGDADDDSKRLWTACKSLVDTWGAMAHMFPIRCAKKLTTSIGILKKTVFTGKSQYKNMDMQSSTTEPLSCLF